MGHGDGKCDGALPCYCNTNVYVFFGTIPLLRCDFQPWRLGNHSFWGVGPSFALDTTKTLRAVTQAADRRAHLGGIRMGAERSAIGSLATVGGGDMREQGACAAGIVAR